MIRYLMGFDDADGTKSLTTGELVRRLAEWLSVEGIAQPQGVTRHQLLVKKRVPYTAHNSAICMSADTADVEGLWETARDYLALESDRHSHVGLCLARWESIHHDVVDWGQRAKREVLTLENAEKLAAKSHIRLRPVKGTGRGCIGALAAVGLHREGNDGRFLWLPGLLGLQGRYSVGEIFERSAIDRVCSLDEVELPIHEPVEIGPWVRPVLRNGQATLYVEEKKRGWAVLDKDRIKDLSS